MPSPASTAMRAFMRRLLEALDVGALAEQEAQLVDAVQQAVARERLERKAHRHAVGQQQRAGLDVDGHLGARVLEQPLAGRGSSHDDGQQAVLERVAAEDVGESRC